MYLDHGEMLCKSQDDLRKEVYRTKEYNILVQITLVRCLLLSLIQYLRIKYFTEDNITALGTQVLGIATTCLKQVTYNWLHSHFYYLKQAW